MWYNRHIMTKKELEEMLRKIELRLGELGDLSVLVDEGNKLQLLAEDLTEQKEKLDVVLTKLPDDEEKLTDLTQQVVALKAELDKREKSTATLVDKTKELQIKTDELRQETLSQLGKASNEKLAHTFSVVQENLTKERDEWLKKLTKATGFLVFVTTVIVLWQVYETQTIYDLSFLTKIAITSPLIYAVVFFNREYARTRNLIEEYTFKSAIARSFEAYKEILDDAYSKQKLETQKEKLAFILKSVSNLYSSPMQNIKDNHTSDEEISPDIFSSVKKFLIDVYKGVTKPDEVIEVSTKE